MTVVKSMDVGVRQICRQGLCDLGNVSQPPWDPSPPQEVWQRLGEAPWVR